MYYGKEAEATVVAARHVDDQVPLGHYSASTLGIPAEAGIQVSKRAYWGGVRFPMAQSAPVVRMKICPPEIAGELRV